MLCVVVHYRRVMSIVNVVVGDAEVSWTAWLGLCPPDADEFLHDSQARSHENKIIIIKKHNNILQVLSKTTCLLP